MGTALERLLDVSSFSNILFHTFSISNARNHSKYALSTFSFVHSAFLLTVTLWGSYYNLHHLNEVLKVEKLPRWN